MNRTLFLIGHEVKLTWKDFKYSLRRSMTILMIIEVIVLVALVFAVLETGLSALFNLYPETLENLIASLITSGFTASRISDIIYFILAMFFVASLVRGLLSSSFGLLFTRVDENVVNSSPTAPKSLYVAEKFRRFLTHVLMVTTLLFAIFPLIWRIGFNGTRFLALFVSLLAFMELYGFTENVFYCLPKMIRARRRSTQVAGVMLTIVLASFIIVSPFLVILGGGSSTVLAYFYPPYLLSRMLTFSLTLDVILQTALLVLVTLLLALAAAATARFGLIRWASSPRLAQTRGSYLRFRKDRLTWKATSNNSANLIFSKDFWVTVRNPTRFFVPFLITIVLLAFLLQLQLVFVGSEPTVSPQFSDQVFLLLAYLVSALALPPAWDSFAGERRTLFILKASPLDPAALVKGKYLFALMKSAIYIAPIIISMSLLLTNGWIISCIVLEVALTILISNAVGILVSVSYPPAYRGGGLPPFLIVLGLPLLCVILTMIIPISFILFYRDTTLFAIMSVLVLVYAFILLRLCLRRTAGSFIRLQESL